MTNQTDSLESALELKLRQRAVRRVKLNDDMNIAVRIYLQFKELLSYHNQGLNTGMTKGEIFAGMNRSRARALGYMLELRILLQKG